MMWRITLCVVLMCCLTLLDAPPAAGQQREKDPAQPVKSRRLLHLAYASVRQGRFGVTSLDVGGMKKERLLEDPKVAMEPVFSPDGKSLAFVSFRTGQGQIFVAELNKGTVANLTKTDRYERSPAWSPDGKRIAFVSNRSGGQEIFVMNRDGSNPLNLTNSDGYDADPVWSPDGKQIAFASARGGGPFRLFVMNADGSDQRPLSDEDLHGWLYPDWSPDGKRIVLGQRQLDDDSVQLKIFDLEKKEFTKITKGEGCHSFPRWSPDGRYIAYARFDRLVPGYSSGMEFDPKLAGGDLMIYDVKSGEHWRLVKGELPAWGPRPAWRPQR